MKFLFVLVEKVEDNVERSAMQIVQRYFSLYLRHLSRETA